MKGLTGRVAEGRELLAAPLPPRKPAGNGEMITHCNLISRSTVTLYMILAQSIVPAFSEPAPVEGRKRGGNEEMREKKGKHIRVLSSTCALVLSGG